MKISNKVRMIVRKPLGKVYSSAAAVKKLKRSKPKKIIVIGDVTGKKLSDAGVGIDLLIYDGKELRKKVKWNIPFPTHIVKNPRGNITDQLMMAINDAIKRKGSRVFVKGEEDLATLYVLTKAPTGAVVLYGQPRKGIVLVKVDRETRKKAISLMKE